MSVSRTEFEGRKWRVVERVSPGGAGLITVSRAEFQAGKQRAGEMVFCREGSHLMSVSRTKFESLRGKIESRGEGQVRRGSHWMNVSRTEFEAEKRRVGERVRSEGVILDECESDRV